MGAILTADLLAFLAEANSVVVATRSAALEPHAVRACGLWVTGEDRVVVLLPRATGAQAIANLADNHLIAVCASSPRDYRTVQLKGRSLEARDGTPADQLTSERQLRELAIACEPYGMSRQRIRNIWLFESWHVELRVTAAFAQTPGPGAGRPHG